MEEIVERRVPTVSMRDMIAKKEEWVAVKVDSIMPAKERQLSTTERTRANAAGMLDCVVKSEGGREVRCEPASMA